MPVRSTSPDGPSGAHPRNPLVIPWRCGVLGPEFQQGGSCLPIAQTECSPRWKKAKFRLRHVVTTRVNHLRKVTT